MAWCKCTDRLLCYCSSISMSFFCAAEELSKHVRPFACSVQFQMRADRFGRRAALERNVHAAAHLMRCVAAPWGSQRKLGIQKKAFRSGKSISCLCRNSFIPSKMLTILSLHSCSFSRRRLSFVKLFNTDAKAPLKYFPRNLPVVNQSGDRIPLKGYG